MTNVEQFLADKNHPETPMYFKESTATVAEAAVVLGTSADNIAKSLAFKLKEGSMVLVVSGESRIENKKYKATFGCKASMLSFDDTLAVTGHPVGGVCPFALPDGVQVFIDVSLKKLDNFYPAAGTPSSAVKFDFDSLVAVTGGKVVDVCKELV